MKVVAVHDLKFHADDVFAIAILKLIFPKIKVVRTRDESKLAKAEARIDVGGEYDSKKGNYDHHQTGGAGTRKNGIPYASAGLIWKHFGKELVSSEEAWKEIDERIIQYVDANDNGVNTHESKKLEPYTIADFIAGLNPIRTERSREKYDEYFEQAVSYIATLLDREIKSTEIKVESANIIRKKIKESNGEYIIVEDNLPWRDVVVKESKIKYVVLYNDLEDAWSIIAVRKSLDKFENRKDLPKKWAGLMGAELQKVTGVKDAIFCHNKLFLAISKSKEGIMELLDMALKNKN